MFAIYLYCIFYTTSSFEFHSFVLILKGEWPIHFTSHTK